MTTTTAPPHWRAYTDRPSAFARKVLHLAPTPQQEQLLTAVAQPGARVAVRSGHGTGKSTALSMAALWFLATRPQAVVPCTAPTSHQLQDILWRELRRLIARMSEEDRVRFAVTSDRIQLKDAAGMIVARTSRPENPDALQGFHAPEMLFVIDEAAGVHEKVFEVARGALSTKSARVALAGNPTRLTGYFHSAFHLARNTWTRLHFSCLESPLVAPSYPAELAAEYGEDSDMYRVRVLGEFPKSGINNLIPLEWVDAAMERKMHPDSQAHASVIIGVDPAWLGGDRTAAVVRRGMMARVLFSVRGTDTGRTAHLVARHAAQLEADTVFVDQTGVGAGVLDQLARTRHPVVGIAFGGSPANPENYVNRRAEMWWRMKDWLALGPSLEANRDLRVDLIGPEYFVNDAGKIQLESKDDMRKRGLASPDLGDALALTFAMPVYPRRREVEEQIKPYNAYEWMERN